MRDLKEALAWLRPAVVELFQRNRVQEWRAWNGREPVLCTYHAPSLRAEQARAWKEGFLPARFWRSFFAPGVVRYPHQWFWDSCAHATVLSRLDASLAKEELRSLLYAQRRDGFIGHMVWSSKERHWLDHVAQRAYPSSHHSPYLQPPDLARAVEAVVTRSGDEAFLRETLPALDRYYEYLGRARDFDGDGLLTIIHSFESGRDRSTEFDAIYGRSNSGRPLLGPMTRTTAYHWIAHWDLTEIADSRSFQAKEVLFNCVYAANLGALARLHGLVGEASPAERWTARWRLVEEALLARCHDPETGLFFSLDRRSTPQQQVKFPTVAALTPLLLEGFDVAIVERLAQHLSDPASFWTRYPLPAEPQRTKGDAVQGHAIWRGHQTWLYTNWLVFTGLRQQARRFPERRSRYLELAGELAWRSYEMVRLSGFREYYDSDDGRGGGAHDFGWSALALEMLLDVAEDAP